MKDALQQSGLPPCATTPEAPLPPWLCRTKLNAQPEAKPQAKRNTRRGVFEGDAAIIELRARLAQARDGVLLPVVAAPDRPSDGAARFIGFVVMAAAMVGTTGYLAGGTVRAPPSIARLAAGPGDTSTAPGAVMPMVHLGGPRRNPGRFPAPPVTIGLARTTDDAAVAAAATERPGSQALFSASAPADASEIAVRMKLGDKLVAAGDISAARMMFERVAEAGDPAGAFALAETYDPAVLETMPLRGGVGPDPALARRWYEKARDMGSISAPQRIARMAGR